MNGLLPARDECVGSRRDMLEMHASSRSFGNAARTVQWKTEHRFLRDERHLGAFHARAVSANDARDEAVGVLARLMLGARLDADGSRVREHTR